MALHGLRPDDPGKLGPYELRGRLGAGGMGVVYLGFGPDGQAVAVKTLPGSASADSRERMRREAHVLESMNFPRVAGLLAADTDAATPWLALAYISGPSLLEAAKPLRDAPLRQFAHGLAEALSVLHEAGVTHRDVKPANVILTFDGPVLVDMGIARTQDMTSITQAGTVIGSAGWMSPEQLRGTAEGPASDVWGWGAVVAYAATGRAPFGEGAMEALAWRIQSLEPNLEGVPDWLGPAVRGALAKDPAARPAAAQLVASAGTRHQPVGPVATPVRAPVQAPSGPPTSRNQPSPAGRVSTGGSSTVRPPSPQGPSTRGGPPTYPTQPRPPGYPYQQGAPAAVARRNRTGLIVAVSILAVVGVVGLIVVLLASTNTPKLAAPGNFVAVVTPTGVNLSWDAVKSADHYAVYRDSQVIASQVAGTTYTDLTGASASHSYYVYAVSSSGAAGEHTPNVPTVPIDGGLTRSPSASSGLNSADGALAGRLPVTLADRTSCVHASTFESPVTVAAVSCAAAHSTSAGSLPSRIYAYQDKTPAEFGKHFIALTKKFAPTNTDCNSPPARDHWAYASDKNTDIGSRLCYLDTNVKKPTIQWTYDSLGIALLAVASDFKASALLSWWNNVDLRVT